jgi:hypothetical protein
LADRGAEGGEDDHVGRGFGQDGFDASREGGHGGWMAVLGMRVGETQQIK